MALPPLPAETSLAVSERLIGQWDFSLEMKQSPAARILTRFLLTNARLIVLQLPGARVASGLGGRLSLRKPPSDFMRDMGRWHVILESKLKDLPEPTLGRVNFGHATALPSSQALIVGAKNYPVGEDAAAESMAGQVRSQWDTVRALRG
jgi:hypothetical protein